MPQNTRRARCGASREPSREPDQPSSHEGRSEVKRNLSDWSCVQHIATRIPHSNRRASRRTNDLDATSGPGTVSDSNIICVMLRERELRTWSYHLIPRSDVLEGCVVDPGGPSIGRQSSAQATDGCHFSNMSQLAQRGMKKHSGSPLRKKKTMGTVQTTFVNMATVMDRVMCPPASSVRPVFDLCASEGASSCLFSIRIAGIALGFLRTAGFACWRS